MTTVRLTHRLALLSLAAVAAPSPALPSRAAPVPAAAPHAQAAARARQEIRRLYRISDGAVDFDDADAVLSLCTPDYTATDTKGHRATLPQVGPRLRRELAGRRRMGIRTYTRTAPTIIALAGDRATVLWSTREESVMRSATVVAHAEKRVTGQDRLVCTARGWRVQRSRQYTYSLVGGGAPSPEAALALQNIAAKHEQFEQLLSIEQQSNDQQQQMRVEQEQHDEQVWRQRHGQ